MSSRLVRSDRQVKGSLTGELYLIFKGKIMPTFNKHLQRTEEEETLYNSCYKNRIILIPRLDRNILKGGEKAKKL